MTNSEPHFWGTTSPTEADGIAMAMRGLPAVLPASTVRAMREATRRLLLVLCALAFFGGTTLGLAAHPRSGA